LLTPNTYRTYLLLYLLQIAGRLVLTNSAVNFIIYGAMNPIYRRAYIALWKYIFCCKKGERRWENIRFSYGSFSHFPCFFLLCPSMKISNS